MDPDENFLSPQRPRGQASDMASIASSHSDNIRPLRKQQSLRLRPSDMADYDEPPSPLNMSMRSTEPPKPKMSLFNLFSKPKVEKQRGYAESTPPPRSPLPRTVSKTNLSIQVEQDADTRRPPSVRSVKTTATKSSAKIKTRDRPPPPPPKSRERKQGPFEPPPLFQAFPQSTKDGKLEVSNMSAETIAQKSKSRKGSAAGGISGDQLPGDRSSVETRRASALKHIANGSFAQVELPRKIFVLVTSGYLLQYSETGSSDRLPEKMLHLGKDSAAFACDLLPGKHYVLQVSQAVDEDGVVVANSGSIFQRLGIRSAAAKRMTSNLLLVMPSGEEMESWMTAIRKEIEILGGTKVQSDIASRPDTSGATGTSLKHSPSHRYQVKRNPHEVSNVTSPRPDQTTFDLPPTPRLERPDIPEAETVTLDGIEREADKLDENGNHYTTRKRAHSDTPSLVSPTDSVDPQQVNTLSSSFDSNTHMSQASQAGTAATTVTISQSSSISGSPPANEQPLQTVPEARRENTVFIQPLPRTSSLSHRRRSATPLAIKISAASKPSLIEESPVVGRAVELPANRSPPRQPLMNVHSEPNFHAASNEQERHDSKMPSPPPVPNSPIYEEKENERPTSIVGDLPDPSTWSTSRAQSRRTSSIQSNAPQLPPAQQSPGQTQEFKSRRVSSFSMPLRVNPSSSHTPPASGNIRRRSQMNDPDAAGDTPAIHTLSAMSDSPKQHFNSQSPTYSSNATGHHKTASLSPSATFSLFPSPQASPLAGWPEPPRRSSSSAGQYPTPPPQTNGNALRRPNSVQIRADHAPFLSSLRNPPGQQNAQVPATAVPIRGMRPSRSASNVAALSQSSPAEAFNGLRFDTPTLAEETDKATPLPSRDGSISHMPKPGSKQAVSKKVRGRGSLPDIGFGIDMGMLGPPAPPPLVPLPAPPPESRATSPTPIHTVNSSIEGIDSVAGLGIRVS